jgi:four helix bundle protein
MNENFQNNLTDRFFNFSLQCFNLISKIPNKKEYEVIKYQLSKSATSIGANYEESQSTTKKEFSQKIRISVREALESRYWLKIIYALELSDKELNANLLVEVNEIIKILRAVLKKTSTDF